MINFDNLEETKEYLLNNGFYEFPLGDSAHHLVTANFQKKYTDEIGKKYFINVDVWDWRMFADVDANYSISFKGQFYQSGTHNALNIDFLYWNLEQVESFIENMFNAGFIEYYEENVID